MREKPLVIILRGRETDPAVNKYCRSLSKHNFRVKLLIWNRRGSIINSDPLEYSLQQFYFHAPLDKFSAVFFYPVWWLYITYFLLKEKPDFIHSCDFDTLIPAMFIMKFRKFKFVYTIFDFYANNIQERKFSLLKKIVRKIDIWGINCSDLLILADESRIEEIQGATVKNLIYIYNSPEEQQFTPSQKIQDSDKKFSIFFAGLLMNFRGITDMIKAVSDLTDVQLTLAGPLIDTDILDVIPPHSDHIKYIGWIPSYQEVLERTQSADILFRFSDPKHPKTKYESPNKLFEAMMCGKPIIVSDNSQMASIVKNEQCGVVIPYGNISAIRNSIMELKDDPSYCRLLGENGYKAYKTKYDWRIMERRLVDSYNTISK